MSCWKNILHISSGASEFLTLYIKISISQFKSICQKLVKLVYLSSKEYFSSKGLSCVCVSNSFRSGNSLPLKGMDECFTSLVAVLMAFNLTTILFIVYQKKYPINIVGTSSKQGTFATLAFSHIDNLKNLLKNERVLCSLPSVFR